MKTPATIARLIEDALARQRIPASQIDGQMAGSQVAPAASGSPGVVDLDDVATLSDATPLALGAADPGDATAASRDDHVHPLPSASDVGAEPALGNPGSNGYVLSSTAAGVRSWVAQSGGGGAAGTFLANIVPSGAVDGSNTIFTLATHAGFGSLQVFIRLPGQTSYSLIEPRSYVAGPMTDQSGGKAYASASNIATGYGSSGSLSSLFDNDPSTACGFNNYGASIDAPVWVSVDLGADMAIRGGTITGMTAGGWSPPRNHIWQYSDDNASWSDAATSVGPAGDGAKTTHAWPSAGAHRYWRLYVLDNHVNGGGNFTAMRELELLTNDGASISSVSFVTAPESGALILVSYQQYSS
jgi:hypothetical protein